jgi:hypothetical protein
MENDNPAPDQSQQDAQTDAQTQACDDLAAAIRASEKDAIADGMIHGISNIGTVHKPLAHALTAFAAAIAQSIPQADSAPSVPSDLLQTIERLQSSIADIAKTVASITAPRSIVIRNETTGAVRVVETAHKQFSTLVSMLNARTSAGERLNVWLVGPAGSGKTHSALQASRALGLPFHSQGSLVAKHECTGYRDATGGYVRTAFREAWEFGGVLLLDEFDGSMPNAVIGINQALSSAAFTFPDATVPKHNDFCCIAACNTGGAGSTEYIGRLKQDKASLDRFIWLDWEIDESLERKLASDTQWAKRVQKARKLIAAKGINATLITPRATIQGCALLASGLSIEEVDRAVLRKGIPADQWGGIAADLPEWVKA